jgi:hypothetical protein
VEVASTQRTYTKWFDGARVYVRFKRPCGCLQTVHVASFTKDERAREVVRIVTEWSDSQPFQSDHHIAPERLKNELFELVSHHWRCPRRREPA